MKWRTNVFDVNEIFNATAINAKLQFKIQKKKEKKVTPAVGSHLKQDCWTVILSE